MKTHADYSLRRVKMRHLLFGMSDKQNLGMLIISAAIGEGQEDTAVYLLGHIENEM